MGRRSTHTPEELRQLILDASRSLIEARGLIGYSAREIARTIGYSAGTLYNVFKDLDDVLLTLQEQLLDDAAVHLRELTTTKDKRDMLTVLAHGYVQFAIENRHLWNLLFQHQPPRNGTQPDRLHRGINEIVAIVAQTVAPILPHAKPEEIDRSARILWAGVHGMTAIAVTDKASTLIGSTAPAYVNELTSTFVRGLQAKMLVLPAAQGSQ